MALLSLLTLVSLNVTVAIPSKVDVDVWLDDERIQCTVEGRIVVDPRTRELNTTCDDGREIVCTVAPWNWVYDQPNRHFQAVCNQLADAGFTIEVNPATQAASPSGSATWQVRVRNTGPGPLQSIQIVTSPATSGCNRAFSNLNAGGLITYSCGLFNITSTTTVEFSGSATRAGAPATTLTTATVQVGSQPPTGTNFSYEVCRTPTDQIASPTNQANWQVTLRNLGDLPIRSVHFVDSVASTCSRQIGAVAVGAEYTFNCSSTTPGDYSATLSAIATEAAQGFITTALITANVREIRPDPIFRGTFGVPPNGH